MIHTESGTAGKPIPKPGKTNGKIRKGLIKKLDALFSKFIVSRDGKDGYAICVTCQRARPIWPNSVIDCGHFQSRRYFATRWMEENCAAQCRYCNRMNQGEQARFAAALDVRYGAGTAKKLEVLARMKPNRPPDIFTLRIMIEEYTKKGTP